MRIAFVINNAAFFVSHRLPIARGARDSGHDVMLLTGEGGSVTMEERAVDTLQSHGIDHRAVAFRSAGVNPLREARGLVGLVAGLRRFRPDLVHCASPKGILYGGIAARLVGVRSLVLAVSGMGFLFTGASAGWRARLARLYVALARFVYRHPNKRVIVQNRDDWQSLQSGGFATASELVLIPGSGVCLDQYAGIDDGARADIVLLPARMLRDKGVAEFVAAARQLRAAGCRWRFVLVGTADYQNPTTVPADTIRGWVDEGVVEWWGHRDDMPAVFAQARIVCLPSYREGMPKALLEAAAAGCAVVTTNVVGCREAIVDGVTGDLVPAADAAALARCLAALIADPERLRRYAAAGRQRATERFSEEAVVARTLQIYEELNHVSRG